MVVANALQASASLICVIAYLPQLYRLYRDKSSRDISVAAWLMWSVSNSFGLFYAIVYYLQNDSGLFLVAHVSVCLALNIATLMCVVLYRKNVQSNLYVLSPPRTTPLSTGEILEEAEAA